MYKTVITISNGNKIEFVHENICMDYEVDFNNGFKFKYEYKKLNSSGCTELFQNKDSNKNNNFISVFNDFLICMDTFKLMD